MFKRPLSYKCWLRAPVWAVLIAWLLLGWHVAEALATDVPGVLPAALDQPRASMYVTRTNGGAPITGDFGFGLTTFTIDGYLDTGASGVLLSNETASLFGIQNSTFNNQQVTYNDVGVNGVSTFAVSEPLYTGVASFTNPDLDNPATYSTVYNQKYGPLRMQVGPVPVSSNPLSDDLSSLFGGVDVIGMPAMLNKVVVMDPKPVDGFATFFADLLNNPGSTDITQLPFMDTKIYNAGNAAIPVTNRHVALSYGAFDRYTQVTPSGAPGPLLAHSPIIGSNPVPSQGGPQAQVSSPGVTIALGGLKSTGSFLLDTGAATSMISTAQATKLDVRYTPGTGPGSADPDHPQLETYDPLHPANPGTPINDQFTLQVQGVDGTPVTAAGFYLDSMLLPTMEATPGNDNDPRNIRFTHAPVLVFDVGLKDPVTNESLTLDGIFGMNYLVASAQLGDTSNLDLGNLGDLFQDFSNGNFNWVVFDEANGVLGLDLKGAAVPEPASIALLGSGMVLFLAWRKQQRTAQSLTLSGPAAAR